MPMRLNLSWENRFDEIAGDEISPAIFLEKMKMYTNNE